MKLRPPIYNPSDHPVQVILTDAFQMGYVLEQLLSYTGRARLTVSTFSTGEEFLRKMLLLRRMGLVSEAVLYTDFKAAEKTARLSQLIRAAYDKVNFCANHSKVMVIEGDITVVVLSSQNQTRGNRLESYTILLGDKVAASVLEKLQSINTYNL